MDMILIVLNYNDFGTTEEFLKRTRNFKIIDKIIIVDNCSTDDSFEKLSTYADENIDVIKTDENKGYANGNNYGIRYAVEKYNPKYFIISNPDVILNKEALRAIRDFYESHDEHVGIVSCKMVCNSGVRTRSAWKIPDFIDCILENLFVVRKVLNLRRTTYGEEYFNTKYSEVEVVPGSFFVIKSKVMEEIKLFDEDTFLYGEENILAYKLRNKGYTNYILNEYSYIHNHSISISKSIKSLGKKLDMAYEGRCIYLNKYLKINRIMSVINAITYRVGKFNYLVFSKIMKRR